MENNIDMRFAIAINSDFKESDIIAIIKNTIPHFVVITPVALKVSKNMLVLDQNDLYDLKKINEENGWLYYKYELSVFPVEETTLEYQRDLADLLLKIFRGKGLMSEIISDDNFSERRSF